MTDLPKTWTKTSLDEIGTLFCGQSPAAKDVNREGRGTLYVTGPEQWDGSSLHQGEPACLAFLASVTQ